MTLQCRSEIVLDTFHLFKEGSLAPAQSLSLQDTTAPLQANFTLSPMTSAHHGTYRCYGSHSTSPYVLSNPSDPLQLLISGKEPQPRSSGSWSVQGADLRTALGWGGREGVTEGGGATLRGMENAVAIPIPPPSSSSFLGSSHAAGM